MHDDQNGSTEFPVSIEYDSFASLPLIRDEAISPTVAPDALDPEPSDSGNHAVAMRR